MADSLRKQVEDQSPFKAQPSIREQAEAASPFKEPDEPERGFFGDVVDFGERAVKFGERMIMGEHDPELDLPEARSLFSERMGPMFKFNLTPEQLQARAAMNALDFPRSVEGQMTALSKAVPGVRFGADSFGSVFVELPGGERGFLNKSGATAQDLEDFAAEALFQAPAIIAASRGGARVAGGPGRIGGAAVGAGGGAAARDVVARFGVGSEEGIDPIAAGISAGTAGLFEGFAPLIVSLFRRVFGNKKLFDPETSTLTPKGERVIRKAGIDPDSVTPEFVREFSAMTGRGVPPSEAAAAAEAASMPVPVRLSRGDVTRRPADQALEDAARKDAFGIEAGAQARGFREGQQADIRGNVGAIQAELGGGRATVEAPGAGMGRVQGKLAARRQALKNEAKAAYDDAKARGTTVLGEAINPMRRSIRRDLVGEFNPATAPKTFTVLAGLKAPAGKKVRTLFVKLKAIENWRQQMSALTRSSDPIERAAASQAIRLHDDFMNSIVERGLILGDRAGIAAYRRARGLWGRLKSEFDTDKLAASIMERQPVPRGAPPGTAGEFVLTPTEALNKLFTVSTLGAKQGAVGALKRIKKLLGESSTEWKALKEEGFLRLLASQEKGNVLDQSMRRVLSGDKFSSALRGSLRDSPEMMRALYSRQEIAQMVRLKNVWQRATGRMEGAINTSNTAIVGRILNNFGWLGQSSRALAAGALTKARTSFKASEAAEMLAKPVRPRPPAPARAGLFGIAPARLIQEEARR